MARNKGNNLHDYVGERGEEAFRPLKESEALNYDELLKSGDDEFIASTITEGSFGEVDFMKKDSLDRFLDFIYFKVQTGNLYVINMVYPTKRMRDPEMEKKIIRLMNYHLYPEIIFRLLKFFTRNMHDPDTNLYIAYFIESDDIIKALFDTFKLFKRDIFNTDPDKRALNVKRIQQFSPMSERRLSSPLDKAAILKYILQFLALKQNVSHIYTKEDIAMTPAAEGRLGV
jgi:hypothetical protein